MSSADKAEKIIRDIETIIRREAAQSAVYLDFEERLQELIHRKQELNEDIERILLDLEKLYHDVDEVENRRSRFLLTAPPLRMPGAAGSPVTPVATV
ncbi:MAG: hypothetical protein A3F74_11705 [Betaproteobacteria bacterium RIFCSPLOWO2_12_FULL_62_58]|nr:MAG: hypothetical protein A3F74_11705 [Betaproteobacteria bacterium RIFCSPLOWO2_12_FULL_62_58]